MSNHLFDAFENAITDRARPFLELSDGKVLSYQDMFDLSAQLANVLVSFDVQPDDRIAVQVDKSAEALILYLACLRVGAIYLPLNTAYMPQEVRYFIADAEPSLFVCDPGSSTLMAELKGRDGVRLATMDRDGGGTLMRLVRSASTDFSNVSRGPNDLAAILYTSGTTGCSKGAMLTHDNLLSNAQALCDVWRFTSADRLIHGLPIFHAHGLFVATNTVLLSASSMYLLTDFDPDRILDLMPNATVMMGVPTHYVRLMQNPNLNPETAANMRLFISGSAPLLAETHRDFREQTRQTILERYGMTETTMITSNPYDEERVAGSVGFPLPGVEIRIADIGAETSDETSGIGMIEVRGPNVFAGYWRMPDKTAEEFRQDGFFITGDLGFIDPQGYLTIVGRGKDLVITGGYNVYPKEVELVIDQFEGVDESAVVGLPHPDFGEGVTAFVVLKPGKEFSEGALVSHLKSCLANYKRPKRIIYIEQLPRNTMGKVQKNLLREQNGHIYQ